MDNIESPDILNEKDPFPSSSAENPWENISPDVESINKHPFEKICHLIEQKTKTPALGLAGLVLGEAGGGKTHLTGRILRHGIRTDSPFSLAYIEPIIDTQRTYRHLLSEIIINLRHQTDKSSNITQMGRILTEIFKETIETECRTSRRETYDNSLKILIKKANTILETKKISLSVIRDLGKIFKDVIVRKERVADKENYQNILAKLRKNPAYLFSPDIAPEIQDIEKKAMASLRGSCAKTFLKVLFQYRISEKRAAAEDWLKGEVIDEDETSLLGTPDRHNASEDFLENEARSILKFIGVLLARYGQPLVVCFDCMENYETDAQIRSFGKMIEFLVDGTAAMVPVAFVRGQLWEEKFRKKLDLHITDRLEKPEKFELEYCSPDQAIELVRHRLIVVYGENEAENIYTSHKDALTQIFEIGKYSPRDVITLAKHHLTSPPETDSKDTTSPSAFEKLREEFETRFQEITDNFETYELRREILREALKLYLTQSPESKFEVSFSNPSDFQTKYVDISCEIRFSENLIVPSVFIIDMTKNHSSVAAHLKRGIVFLENNAFGKAFYIRDERHKHPSEWKIPKENFIHFKSLGGNTVFLDREQAGTWCALERLSRAVKEQGVTVIDVNNHIEPVSQEEFALFVREKIHGRGYKVFKDFDRALGISFQRTT
ncbi:Uncharacterized protein dnm_082510 [Desulfonema magnum]|uniref:Uncharacterized protein n=2 Tax=Desulfonema magnum TaxID=45655 RepID=A0A975GSL4_9BACT|nr:Uncharacterized protein dnm_082510 [Desulfonema magnum]